MNRLIVLLPLLAVIGLFLLVRLPKTEVLPVISVKVTPTVTSTPQPFSEDKLWSLIQNWRQSQGLQPYIKDQRLCAIAEDRVTNDPVMDDHAGFYRKYSNYPYVLSENLASYPEERMMLNGWLGSPTHLANLKKPYAYSCIACKYLGNSDHDSYCSQIFSNL